MPNISASPSESASAGLLTSFPGASTASPYLAAAAENKAIFVHFGASWCGWCRKLDAFLERPALPWALGFVTACLVLAYWGSLAPPAVIHDERAYLVQKLRENGWNISKTAEVIGTPRSNLYKKLEQYGIRQDTDG